MKPRTFFRTLTAALSVALVGTGCAPDRATAPEQPSVAAVRDAGPTSFYTPILTAPGTAVPVMQREHALRADASATQLISPSGGVVRIASAGLTLYFAPGAVSAPLQVTATANAGAGVVYSFEPHGTVFKAPVYVVQDLGVTTIRNDLGLAGTIAGAYMPDGLSDLAADGTATVSEIHTAAVNKVSSPTGGVVLGQAIFEIQHFSGYILTVGRH